MWLRCTEYSPTAMNSLHVSNMILELVSFAINQISYSFRNNSFLWLLNSLIYFASCTERSVGFDQFAKKPNKQDRFASTFKRLHSSLLLLLMVFVYKCTERWPQIYFSFLRMHRKLFPFLCLVRYSVASTWNLNELRMKCILYLNFEICVVYTYIYVWSSQINHWYS